MDEETLDEIHHKKPWWERLAESIVSTVRSVLMYWPVIAFFFFVWVFRPQAEKGADIVAWDKPLKILLLILASSVIFGVSLFLWSKYRQKKKDEEDLPGKSGSSSLALDQMRFEIFAVVIGISIAGWFVKPDIYTEWIPDNKRLATLVIIGIILLLFFKPPRRTGMFYWVLFTVTAMAVFKTLPETTQENILAWRPWPATTHGAVWERNKAVSVANSEKIELPPVIARYGTFTEIADIPSEFGRIDFQCPPGVLVAIVHKNLPGGKVKDCGKDKIGLGNDLEELRLWVRSKNPDKEILVVVAYIPRRY